MILDTARLRLRKIVADDVDALVDLDSDPEVMRYLTGGVPSPRSFYEGPNGALARMLTWGPDDPLGFYAALREGAFVGWLHLRPTVAGDDALELGWRLRRRAWGQGLATEGARALARRAFDLGAAAVDACAMPDNAASIAVMRRCGMNHVGAFVHPRGGMTVVRYLATRADFEAAVDQRR